MSYEHKKVFISYSWDNENHQRWVLDLMNRLRDNGVDASMDLIHTQNNTVNLNSMMVSGIRDNDYVIIVLTENYANKSDGLQGGVGFETLLTMPLLQQNPQKLIFILRHNKHWAAAIPFHLSGWYAIDFSNNRSEKAFRELLHRIEGVPMYEQRPLGSKPILSPNNLVEEDLKMDFSEFDVPKLRKITDFDKEQFIKENYKNLNDLFRNFFDHIKSENTYFSYIFEETQENHTFKLFVNGELKTALKLWLSNDNYTPSIKLAFGNQQHLVYDNSYNESIICYLNDNKELGLKMTMSVNGQGVLTKVSDIVKDIWKNHLSHYIK